MTKQKKHPCRSFCTDAFLFYERRPIRRDFFLVVGCIVALLFSKGAFFHGCI